MRTNFLFLAILMVGGLGLPESPAAAQVHDDDPAALEAFTTLVETYRNLPAWTVRSDVQVKLTDAAGNAGQEQAKSCEMTFAGDQRGIVRINGFVCHLVDGSITAVHEETDHSYFTSPDDGAPYYALLISFVDLPYPHLAIGLGEESVDDLLMQFHTKTPWIRPTAVSEEVVDGEARQKIMLTSDFAEVEVLVDPETKLIGDLTVSITGGDYVQPGYTLTYNYDFEYEIHEQPLADADLRLDPGQRQRVDMMATLVPEPEPQAVAQAPQQQANDLIGNEAPNFVLATLDGGAVELQELRGKVVVVDFWATWCGPCVRAMPAMHEIAEWIRDNELPVTMLMVNVWEEPRPDVDTPEKRLESVRSFWEDKGFTLPVAMDYTDETAAEYGVTGIPSTFIIRSDGIVHAHHSGFPGTQPLKAEIQAAIDAFEDDGADD